jgi:asparagine synthase (glutamine-hydrolysing)
MCGISGYVGRGMKPEQVRQMNSRIAHRGPDHAGYYFGPGVGLGNRRLSILDVEGGNQPVFNESGEIAIVYNGEIYNSPELRTLLEKRGHVFRTHTDTEVLVHLYEDEGEGLVRRLEGMFAFAIWDTRTATLVLGRDRFGVKPLYYAHTADHISFASELGALLEDTSVDRTPDLEALDAYLELNYIPGPLSAYKGVRKLPAAHVLRWHRGDVKLFRYWTLPDGSESSFGETDEEELIQRLDERLRVAVRRRLLSDVPLGLFLSGGLDSSAVLAYMAEEVSGSVKSFSIGFSDARFSELPAARKVAKAYGCDHNEMIVEPDAIRDLPQIFSHFHEPFGDSSALPTYHVARLAKTKVKVCLGGDGGDELFAGYQTYSALRLSRMYDRWPIARKLLGGWVDRLPVGTGKVPLDYKLKKFRRGMGAPFELRPFAWKSIFPIEERMQLWNRQAAGDAAARMIGQMSDEYEGDDWLNRALYLDGRLYLVDDILVKLDRMTMAHSLEGREPLLDSELAEFIARVPGEYKLRGVRGKYLFRKVLERKLPPSILRRGKQGFSIPLGNWLRGPLKSAAEDHLLSAPADFQAMFNREYVEKLLQSHQSKQADLSRQIWNLMAIASWMSAASSTPACEPSLAAA